MSVDLATVRSSLLRYEDAFQKKIGSKKPKVAAELSKIDRWLRNELPAVVKGRNPPSILPTDLRCGCSVEGDSRVKPQLLGFFGLKIRLASYIRTLFTY